MRKPEAFDAVHPRITDWVRYGPYRAVVGKVIDGDTLDVLVDLGFNNYTYETIRLYGIDCPERNTEEGQKAKAFVEERLPKGTVVAIKTGKDTVTFGRYVANVLYAAGEGVVLDLASELKKAGFEKGAQ